LVYRLTDPMIHAYLMVLKLFDKSKDCMMQK